MQARQTAVRRSKLKTDAKGAWTVAGLKFGTYRITVQCRALHARKPSIKASSPAKRSATRSDLQPFGKRVVLGAPVNPNEDVDEVTVKGEKPPREVVKRTLHAFDELERIPGTNGDALARDPKSSRRRAAARHCRFAHRPRIQSARHAGLRRRHADSARLSLRRIVLGRADRDDRQDRLLPRKFQHPIRSRNRRHRRRRHSRSEKRSDSRYGASADFIDLRAMVEGPIGKGWTFAAAGRRSYFDLWLKPVLEASRCGRYDRARLLRLSSDDSEGLRLASILQASLFRIRRPLGSFDQERERIGSRAGRRYRRAHRILAHVQARYIDKLSKTSEMRLVDGGWPGLHRFSISARTSRTITDYADHRPSRVREQDRARRDRSTAASTCIIAPYSTSTFEFSAVSETGTSRRRVRVSRSRRSKRNRSASVYQPAAYRRRRADAHERDAHRSRRAFGLHASDEAMGLGSARERSPRSDERFSEVRP